MKTKLFLASVSSFDAAPVHGPFVDHAKKKLFTGLPSVHGNSKAAIKRRTRVAAAFCQPLVASYVKNACKWRGLRRQPTGQTGAASLHKPAERPIFLSRFMRLNPHNPAAPLQPAYSQVATLAACLASLWVGHARALTCGADDPFIVLSSLSECSESP